MCLFAFFSLRRKPQGQTAKQNTPAFLNETLNRSLRILPLPGEDQSWFRAKERSGRKGFFWIVLRARRAPGGKKFIHLHGR